MKRIFGLVGYACNGKSTIIKEIADLKNYEFIDLPKIYKYEASKNGYSGVTEWYTAVGLKRYSIESKKAVLNYIDKEIPRTKNLIIDDIFDIDVYLKLKKIFPQIKLIAFHSKYSDRLKRLSKRASITDEKELTDGLKKRDEMKRYCGIEEIFPHCKFEITNKHSIDIAKKMFENEIKKNLIICIVGYSGCGKSTLTRYVSESLNLPVFEYGKEVTKLINKAGYSKSREYIESLGIDSYIKYIESNIDILLKKFMRTNKFFIIDGIVSSDIFDLLSKKNDVCTIYLKLSKDNRVKRIMQREKTSKTEAIKNLDKKDGIKINCGLDIIVSRANYVVDSSKNLNYNIDNVLKVIEDFNK